MHNAVINMVTVVLWVTQIHAVYLGPHSTNTALSLTPFLSKDLSTCPKVPPLHAAIATGQSSGVQKFYGSCLWAEEHLDTRTLTTT